MYPQQYLKEIDLSSLPPATIELKISDFENTDKKKSEKKKKEKTTIETTIDNINNEKKELHVIENNIDIEISLPYLKIIQTLTFENDIINKTLEGQLIFPLPEQAIITRYGLDVNSIIVDAVPVEKEKAKQIFENEVQNYSQSLVSTVEQVVGNVFKTRIYPLHYKQKRIIRLEYLLTMKSDSGDNNNFVMWLPQSFHKECEVNLFTRLMNKKMEKVVNNDYELNVLIKRKGLKDLEITKKENNNYLNSKLQNTSLIEGFVVTVTDNSNNNNNKDTQLQSASTVAVNGDYFHIRVYPKKPENIKKLETDHISIIWDSSLSRLQQRDADIDLLKKILLKLNPKRVSFITFSNDIQYEGKDMSVNDLLNYIDTSLIYDGGSNINCLQKILNQQDGINYSIVFTDGFHNYGKPITFDTIYNYPMYIISNSSNNNANYLKYIATNSGGMFIDKNQYENEDVLIDLIGRPLHFFLVADYEEDDFEEIYPNVPTTIVGGVFDLYGKVKHNNEDKKIAISFRLGNELFEIQTISLPIMDNNNGNNQNEMKDEEQVLSINTSFQNGIIPLLWAQKKIEFMSVFPDYYQQELKQIGEEWCLVTPNTSLLVLETLEQYLKYKIVPPKTRSDIYNQYQQIKEKEKQTEEYKKLQKIEQVVSWWIDRKHWHSGISPQNEENFNFDYTLSSNYTLGNRGGRRGRGGGRGGTRSRRTVTNQYLSTNENNSDGEIELGGAVEERTKSKKKKKSMSTEEDNCFPGSQIGTNADIVVKAWSPDVKYLKKIKNVEKEKKYEEYLKQRNRYQTSPSFYLDVASYFLTELKEQKLGITILTNILELDLENTQLFRIVGYRLDQENYLEAAEMIFEKVKKLSPNEPQSFRDLALIKERLGKFEEAISLLNHVICGEWGTKFEQIEVTAVTELNHILFKSAKRENEEVNSELKTLILDERLIHKFDLDLRVSLGWDTDETDIDLHVIEPKPKGQECYYGNRNTPIGGHLSIDFRHGYGPEEYILRQAEKGIYKVGCRYFANHRQDLTGGTTVLCCFFTNYMRENEKKEMVTVRLAENKDNLSVCNIEIK